MRITGKSERWFLLACLMLIAAGVVARIHGLAINGFWYDELVSLSSSDPSRPFVSIVLDTPANAVQPPLFALTLSLWRRMFGDGETAVRLLSVLFGITTIGLSYQSGRRLLDGGTAILFAVFMACSFGGIVYSQECRPYALMVLLATGLTLALLRGVRELRDNGAVSRGTILWLAATGILASYTHYFGLLFAGAVCAVLLFHALLRRARMRLIIGSGIAILLVLLPWLAHELPRKAALSGSYFWASTHSRWDLHQAKIWMIYSMGPAAPVLIPVLLARLWTRALDQGWRAGLLSRGGSLLSAAGITSVFALLVSLHTPLIVARYFLVTTPAVLLAAAVSLEDGPLAMPPSRSGRLALGVGCAFLMLTPLAGYYVPFKQQFREAAAFIQNDPRCMNSRILVWKEADWVTERLAEYGFYISARSGIELVSTAAATVESSRPARGECPVLLWVAHQDDDPDHPLHVMHEFGLDANSVRVVRFRGSYVLLDPTR